MIAGKPLRGHADACLAAIGWTAPRRGWTALRRQDRRWPLDGYLVAEGESADVPGVLVADVPLLMTDPGATAAMVAACRRLVGI
ncbi:MAG: hypothetical protein WKF57_14905 [Nakamurella sp.]